MFVSAKLVCSFGYDHFDCFIDQKVEICEFIILFNHVGEVLLGNYTRNFAVLFGSLSQFLPSYGVICGLHVIGWLLGEYVLNGQNLVKKLKFLLCDSLVCLVNHLPVKFFDLLEAIYDETAQGHAIEHLIIEHL